MTARLSSSSSLPYPQQEAQKKIDSCSSTNVIGFLKDELEIFPENREKENKENTSTNKSIHCLKRKRNNETEDEESKKEKRTRVVYMKQNEDNPDLPEEYKRLTNRGTAELVIQKELTASDVNSGLNRLTLPAKSVNITFLRPNEMKGLKKNDMKVSMIDPCMEKEEISVGTWKMSSAKDKSLVLKHNWNYIVEKNDLRENDRIQVWSFRDDNEALRLALVVVERAKKREIDDVDENVDEGENGETIAVLMLLKLSRGEEGGNCKDEGSIARNTSVDMTSVTEDNAIEGQRRSARLRNKRLKLHTT